MQQHNRTSLVAYYQNEQVFSKFWSTGNCTEVGGSELSAVQSISVTHITICSDSSHGFALSAILSSSPSNNLKVDSIRQFILNQQRFQFQFRWCPTHKSITGNEKQTF